MVAASGLLALGGTAAAARLQPGGVVSSRHQDLGPAALVGSRGVTWHPISLRNGWVPTGRSDSIASPSWAVSHGIVYLRGAVRQAAARRLEFALLPKAARPPRTIDVEVSTGPRYGGSAYIEIQADGAMTAHIAPRSSQATALLTAMSYPQAGASVARGMHKLTLLNGWVPYHARASGDPSYTLSGRIVYLSGSVIKTRHSGRQPFARLPKVARPMRVMYVTAYDGIPSNAGTVKIAPNGYIYAFDVLGPFISLTGISYPAAGIRMPVLQLQGGWTPLMDAGQPSYAVVGGVVYLVGAANPPDSGCCTITVLPAGAAPRHLVMNATVEILPGGAILGNPASIGNSGDFSSLAGISYPLHS